MNNSLSSIRGAEKLVTFYFPNDHTAKILAGSEQRLTFPKERTLMVVGVPTPDWIVMEFPGPTRTPLLGSLCFASLSMVSADGKFLADCAEIVVAAKTKQSSDKKGVATRMDVSFL